MKSQRASKPFVLDKANAVATPQVKLTQNGLEFRIDLKWYSKSSRFIITFALMWNAIIGFIGYALFFVEDRLVRNANMGYMVVGLFGFIGLCLAYSAICEILNTTTILLKNDKLSFWTKPLSMNGDQIVNVNDIANFSVERIEGGQQNDRKVFKHFVNIQLRNGDLVRMCKVQNINEGMYIEKLLEEKLALTDDPSLDRIAF